MPRSKFDFSSASVSSGSRAQRYQYLSSPLFRLYAGLKADRRINYTGSATGFENERTLYEAGDKTPTLSIVEQRRMVDPHKKALEIRSYW
jgi:hypothetical protein